MKRWWILTTMGLAATIAAPTWADDPQANSAGDEPQAAAPAEPAAEAKPADAESADAKAEDAKPEDAKGDGDGVGSILPDVATTLKELFGLQRYGRYQKNHDSIRDVFKTTIQKTRKATVAIVSDGELQSLGAVIDPDGLIVTKASELDGDLICRFVDGKEYAVRVVASDTASDLALLKIDASDLPTVDWAADVPSVGSWVVTAGLDESPLAVGVVSVDPRDFRRRALLGVGLDDNPAGVRINRVVPDSGAEEAGIHVNDVIQAVNGEEVKTHTELISLVQRYKAGDRLLVQLKRGGDSLLLGATLKKATELDPDDRKNFQNTLGGQLSERRGGFTGALQHDTVLQPQYCGGPICDLDGKVVGINICRAGRVESYALPSSSLVTLLDDMKAGKKSLDAAAAVRKSVVDSLLDVIAEYRRSLDGELAKRETKLADAEAKLADAERTLEEAKAAAAPVADEVAAAEKRVEGAANDVKSSKKSLESLRRSLETAEKEAGDLREELSALGETKVSTS